MMKVALISPPFSRYAGIKGHGGLSAPLNLGYLASYVLSNSDRYEVEILDAEALNLSYEVVVDRLREAGTGLVGITTTTPSFDVITHLCRDIHAALPNIEIVLGGPHATALPEESLLLDGVRYVVVGEGERTFLELLDAVSDNGDLAQVAGLAYRDVGGHVHVNGPRALIQDLDTIPMPARDRMPFHLYYSPPTKSLGLGKVITMLTSRGCPYNCRYCISGVMWGRGNVRYRSAESVLEEMAICIETYGGREFNFHDDLFVAKKQRLIDICKGIIDRGWKVGWVCMARVDFIDEDRVAWMKKAGCRKIAFGIESGSEMILESMNKRLDTRRVKQAFDICRKYRIKTGASFMMGYLNETEETIGETIALMKKLNPDTVAIFQASPYPGTEFYREALRLGYLRDDFKWEDYAIVTNSESVLNLPNLSSRQIRYWVKRAYREFYLRPTYVLSQFSQIRSWSDVRNLLMGMKILFNVSRNKAAPEDDPHD